jgi:hypothetical protein
MEPSTSIGPGPGATGWVSHPADGAGARPPATQALRDRYARYRIQQGRELLTLLPREGIRALLRHRLASARPRESSGLAMEELAAACADLLPLPPFERWLQDFRHNRTAYLESDTFGPAGPQSPEGAPVTVAVRSFLADGEAWTAELVVHPDGPRWCGLLHFHRGEGEPMARTGEIFRESRSDVVRDRFRSFDDHTLRAFLRSSLP